MSFEQKYLKYKKKYILAKKSNTLNQKGGEAHYSSIRKQGNVISFPNGFPNLVTNGNYHIIHAFDQLYTSKQNKSLKIEELNMWVNQTFNNGLPPQGNDIINKVANIWQSNQRQDLIDLVNWLNDAN